MSQLLWETRCLVTVYSVIRWELLPEWNQLDNVSVFFVDFQIIGRSFRSTAQDFINCFDLIDLRYQMHVHKEP